MARHEAEREDLLAEGVNMPQRGRVTSVDSGQEWIVGWRNESSLSLYVGQDPVFQFNAKGELRRAFINGQKLAAHDRHLCQLVRVPAEDGRLTLSRQRLDATELAGVRDLLEATRVELRTQLNSGNVEIATVGVSLPMFTERLQTWMEVQADRCEIAISPHTD